MRVSQLPYLLKCLHFRLLRNNPFAQQMNIEVRPSQPVFRREDRIPSYMGLNENNSFRC